MLIRLHSTPGHLQRKARLHLAAITLVKIFLSSSLGFWMLAALPEEKPWVNSSLEPENRVV